MEAQEYRCDECDATFDHVFKLNGHVTGKHRHPHEVGPIPHGTQYGYNRCKKETPGGSCEACRTWNREWHRKMRRQRRRRSAS